MNKLRWRFLFVILVLLGMHMAVADTQYPDELKQAVALYPNAEVIQTVKASGVTMAILKVSDKPDAILKFYRAKLTDKGWQVVTEFNQGEHITLVFEKGENNLMIDASIVQPGESMINMTLSPKK